MQKHKQKTFSQSLERLEKILERLQSSDCELEESLELLEEGLRIHKVCKSKLEEADIKIQKILKSSSKSDLRTDQLE